MTLSYNIEGMTCGGCVASVKSALLKMSDVLSADVTLPNKATIEMKKHLTLNELQQAISLNRKYVITEDHSTLKLHGNPTANMAAPAIPNEAEKTWLTTYKPLLIIFALITLVSYIAATNNSYTNPIVWMRYFMAGFFLVFSFFKLLDVKGFASAYAGYDLLAKAIPSYGYVYPFIELTLGLLYLVNFNSVMTNAATVLVMGFSSIGVLQAVSRKQTIQCACLGSFFNLPMTTVTIVEDLLMVAMASGTLITLLFLNN